MRLLGAALVIGAFGGAGLAAVEEMERQLRLLREMERAVGLMRTEVCRRHTALPDMLAVLASEYPARFSGAEESGGRLSEQPFSELWESCVRRIELPAEAEQSLIRLGSELSGGFAPEDSFSHCTDELHRLIVQAAEKKNQNARLYLAGGAALGCMVVIVLL